jgi:hypothetical protein
VVEDAAVAVAATELCNAAVYTDERSAFRGRRNRHRDEIAQELDSFPWLVEGLPADAADARWQDRDH